MKLIMGLPERFWAKTRIENTGYETECLVWTAYKLPNGYGRYGVSHGDVDYAHRVVYRAVVGPIADGLVIDHLCRVRSCVNPSHLEPVTNRINILRGETIMAANAAKTHCANGHPFTPENTRPASGGGRVCITCNREWRAARTERARVEREANPKPPRTHCRRGHALTDETSFVNNNGVRCCRICIRDSARLRESRKKATR